MPFTYRSYRVHEIALSVFHGGTLASGHERVRRGDIIACRIPTGGIGFKEMAHFLWLLVYGLDDNEMRHLCEPMGGFDNSDVYDKRRYCVPFQRLGQLVPGFNAASARDESLVYQPFLPVDEDNGRQVARGMSPLPVQGLVFDKQRSRYI